MPVSAVSAVFASLAGLATMSGCSESMKMPGMTSAGSDSALCPLYTSGIDATLPYGPSVAFVDGARAGGIDVVAGVDPKTRSFNYLDWMGSGVCIFDYDGDGRPDLFFASRPGAPPCAGPPSMNRMFHNDGSRRFSDTTIAAGFGAVASGTGCTVGDIDGDGDYDLFVADSASSHLYENRSGVFADVTPQSGIFNTTNVWQTAPTFVDLDGDGLLDLYVGQFNPMGGQFHDLLFHNIGGLHFTDITARSGLLGPPHPTLVTLFFDINFDDKLDIYVGNDFGNAQLFINQGGGVFKEQAFEHGLSNDAQKGRAGSMMGLAAADIDGDGLAEVLASDDSGYPMIVNKCDSSEVCVRMTPAQTGLASTTPDFKWGIGVFDFNDDGKLDMLSTNGFPLDDDVVDTLNQGFKLVVAPFNQRTRLFLNQGSSAGGMGGQGSHGPQFAEWNPGKGDALRVLLSGRAAAFSDLDDDGDIDAVIASYGERPLVLYNQISAPDEKKWGPDTFGTLPRPLNVYLKGTHSSPDPIGAIVTVNAGGQSYTAAHAGGGLFLSGIEPFVHFGLGSLGSRAHVDSVSVHWPAGGDTVLMNVPDEATRITMNE